LLKSYNCSGFAYFNQRIPVTSRHSFLCILSSPFFLISLKTFRKRALLHLAHPEAQSYARLNTLPCGSRFLFIKYQKSLLIFLLMFFLYLSAVVQGISEAFPISSSAHMIAARLFFPALYAQEVTTFSKTDLQLLDVGLHLGTLITISLYFGRDLLEMIKGGVFTITQGRYCASSQKASLLFQTLFYASLPAVVCGAMVSFLKWDQAARSPFWMAVNCAFFGLLLGISNRKGTFQKDSWPMGLNAFWIGCAQAFALFPGVSRLGICVTAACFLNFLTWRAIRFSFLLGFVSIAGALFLKGITAPPHFFQNLDFSLFSQSLLLSIVINLFCLQLLKKIIHRWGLWPFSLYRIFLGFSLLLFAV
jgi:undecaprenyl-diphosphatase